MEKKSLPILGTCYNCNHITAIVVAFNPKCSELSVSNFHFALKATTIKRKATAKYSRKADIMADAAYALLSKKPDSCTGKFLIDEEVVLQAGVKDLKQYACVSENADMLTDDFFLEPHNSKL